MRVALAEREAAGLLTAVGGRPWEMEPGVLFLVFVLVLVLRRVLFIVIFAYHCYGCDIVEVMRRSSSPHLILDSASNWLNC